MTYVRHKAGVPTPEVYFFDSSGNNPLGWEFTIMEMVQDAVRLCDAPDMDEYSDEVIMAPWKKIWDLDFGSKSGSLYCRWDSPCEPCHYFVGPMVHVDFFAPGRDDNMSLVRAGPFDTWEEYARALIDARSDRDWTAVRAVSFGFGGMDVDALPPVGKNDPDAMDVDDADLREAMQQVSAMLDDFATAGLTFKPRMTHHDMHGGNILVYDRRTTYSAGIAAIIDWEAVKIEPAGLIERLTPKAIMAINVSEEDARNKWLLPDEFYAPKAREVRKRIMGPLYKV
ncbi:hypothetical protein QBC43DRAFT_211574 [Cladorrhinum sp. PSN259]|nr:hypothetical protein QBC43DRAFT_211574 [Cladorrhinum sp. PSN259]